MFCPRCGNQYEGNPRFCENCGLTLGQRQAGGPSWVRGMTWFQNHLNWTLVIALVVINAVTFAVVYAAYYYMAVEDADGVYWLSIVGNIILTAVAGAWVLSQKGRSMLWLVLTPFWIGWVVWLALDNKRRISVQVNRPPIDTP